MRLRKHIKTAVTKDRVPIYITDSIHFDFYHVEALYVVTIGPKITCSIRQTICSLMVPRDVRVTPATSLTKGHKTP